MDDYPDPDEEYELMHADEYEAMRDMEDEDDFSPPPTNCKPKSKRSLEFTTRTPTDTLKSRITVTNTPGSSGCTEDVDKTLNLSSCTSSDGCTPFSESKRARLEVDLFGDIEDLEDDTENSSISKRPRIELEGQPEEVELTFEEKQDLLIKKIVEMRRNNQTIFSTSNFIPSKRRAKAASNCMTRKVPSWAFMPVSGVDDKRIYVRFYSEEWFEKEVSTIGCITKSGGLLSVPYDKLFIEAQQELLRIKEGPPKKLTPEKLPPAPDGKDLLVSRYKPRNYLELLSDEGTNRSLLQWLKLWDKVVFGRPVKISKKDGWEGRGQVLTDKLDEEGRPQFRVALLCGPPGLGKTTLAHLIAVQAGYNVVEVNASDDRSPTVFRTQLEAATQMKAVMGEDRRPNCLILDEIDGAPLASIEVLVKFATDKFLRNNKGKGKKATILLKRPIICICNDVYVPALRPLRQIAYTLHFPPTSSARLAERLVQICRKEGVKTDVGSMMALGDKTNNDIRACLSVLHCIKAKGSKVTLSQIQNSKVGVKDMQQGLFTVWQKVFQIVKPKTKIFHDSYSKTDVAVPTSAPRHEVSALGYRMNEILHTVHGCGDYDRLVQGVYENFPSLLNSKAVSLSSVGLALKWFSFHDLVSSNIYSRQNFVLYPYLQYGFVVWHFVFATFSWPKLNYPSVGTEMNQRGLRNRQMLETCLEGTAPHVRAFLSRDRLLHSVPYLLEIIVPNLRTVSSQLLSPKERAELLHVISVMLDYNLNYTQERNQDGVYNYNLDPNLEEVGRFGEWRGERSLSYAGRQLVSRELELERVRRAEAALYRATQGDSLDQGVTAGHIPVSPSPVNPSTPQDKSKKPLPSHLQKLTPKALKKPLDKKSRDFFGRIVECKSPSSGGRVDNIVKSDIWFHFKEGHNNAVRRPICMKDLLEPKM